MSTPSAPSAKRKPAVARRTAKKSDAQASADSARSTEPGMVDQMRAMASRLLDLGSATVLAGRAMETAGKVSRALQDGHPLDAASEVVRGRVAEASPNPHGPRPGRRSAPCASRRG
jgi:hypothetical protein